ncbi:u9-ctenitoxin-Pr1a [Trichonephila inaurata madagascariensis]|uniref:U9-ctenitoxin-Pr1a n=1 Tax=Trichonephila inaurata madagascariensis TaxID=2747483 RepID=A0A8X6JVP9_9ARAC|nr:u9-ctenitoxin-Pr1a [Trichonephila inaurata madagascariensis]
MKGILICFLLGCVVLASGDYCGSLESCGEGNCCSGGFYHRYCRPFADDGMPCEQPNDAGRYSVSCPCKEGLICSPIARCQTPY